MIPTTPFPPAVCVVDFHHARYLRRAFEDSNSLHLRGPEIEQWFGVPTGTDPAIENDWSFLPFMALSDGAHAYVYDSPLYVSTIRGMELY